MGRVEYGFVETTGICVGGTQGIKHGRGICGYLPQTFCDGNCLVCASHGIVGGSGKHPSKLAGGREKAGLARKDRAPA